MVSARVIIATAASLIIATSIEAGSHLSSTFPDRLQAIKRSTMMKHYDLLERTSSYSSDPAVQACVNKCMADPSPSSSSSSSGKSKSKSKSSSSSSVSSSGGSGNKTIIVAPHVGVFKFIPFSTTAAVGEKITFEWRAGPHTVDQSSGVEICNATKAVENPFSSGPQEAGATFDITVELATSPTWFYCKVKTHCLQGMFGLINPVTTTTESNTMATYITNLAAKDSSFASLASDTKAACAGNDAAWGWGKSFDTTSFPESQIKAVAENVMETRKFFAENPQQLIAHGVISPDDAGSISSSASSGSAPSASSS